MDELNVTTNATEDHVLGETLHFTYLDYALFSSMLLFSALIGVYFGFFGKKQNTKREYLHGGRNMHVLPIGASLIASDISGVTLLGVPTDIYMNGSAYWLCVISSVVTGIVVSYVFLPVFFKLQVMSSFEYLMLRFGKTVCQTASFVFALTTILFMPIVIYIPALAFSQVTGLSLNMVIPIVCLICIFYTTFGGIKAVVWTDTLQMLMMVGSITAVALFGVYIEGGFGNIWRINEEGGRIDFNLDIDPTHRTSSFAIVIGLSAYWCSSGNNPMFIQRFLAVPTFEEAKVTVLIFTLGTIFFKSFSSYIGLIMYARYAECDPLLSGAVQKPDQILPYYVMDVASSIPGLPGLFIAGIFCAALSSMSSGLNTMAGTIYEDFLAARLSPTITEKRASTIMKIIVVVLGFICMGLVFVVQHLGTILQLTYNLAGLASGPILAMFSLGMLVPSVNVKGVLYGTVGGVLVVCWFFIGAQYNKAIGRLKPVLLPHSVEGCEIISNVTYFTMPNDTSIATEEDLPFYPYRITFYYYTLIGFLACSLITLPVSWLTGGLRQNISRDLLSPVVYPFLSKKYHLDEKASKALNGDVKESEHL